MTKINRINIHGFKSFANKTVIPFENKFNCILGANGSGKSNIGDSLCFVLGKLSAKSMRAEKAANLVFNGGKKNKPATQGSVEIAFCNKNKIFPHDADEVVINRTVKKAGGSQYRVNGDKKTRTEVLDLLSLAKINPDGYNIILQGDITRFVTMSPLERRRVIEEISDVAIYEEKKHKANLELNKVEDKLRNAEIILKERKTYLRELKRDRDQALKFKELKDKIDSNKATYIHAQLTEKQAARDKYQTQVDAHQTKIDGAQKKVDELKTTIISLKEAVTEINKEIEQKGEKEQVQVHREIEELKVKVAQNKTRTSVLKDEIAKITMRKDQFRQELKELEAKTASHSAHEKQLQKDIALKQREVTHIDRSIVEFKKKHKIESSVEMEKEIDAKDKIIDAKQEEVQQIRQKQQELVRDKDRLEYQLETLDERMSKVKEVAKEHQDQIKRLQHIKTDFKDATLRLNKCLDDDSSYASQVANARKELAELQERHAKLNAKAMSIRASMASNNAVKTILTNKKQFKGVHGTIAELGQVKRQYAVALETAAGGRMQHIVVDDDAVAARCIKYLKDNKLGSAAFIPLNKIRSASITREHTKLLGSSGVHDFALNMISFKPQYKNAFAYVFGNTLVVDDINAARKVGIGTVKMSTLDGSLAEASGVMRGGFRNKRAGGFAEKDSMEELERLDAELNQAQAIIQNIHSKREANMEEVSALRTKRAELEGDIIKIEKTLHLESGDLDANAARKKELQAKLKEADTEIDTVQRKVSAINKDLAMAKSVKHQLRSQVNQLRNPRLVAQLSAFQESRQKCRDAIVRMESDLKNSGNNMSQLLAPERAKIQEIIKQHDKEEQSFTEEIKGLTERVGKEEKDLIEKEKASKEFYAKYKELFGKREKLGNDITKAENDMESMRERTRNAEREINLVALKSAEVKAKLAGLEEEFTRYKDVPLLKEKPVEELKREIAKFEVMLGQMSAVNMKALEIYEQIETEYTKLVEKQQSLHGEKTDVLTLMNEIETKKTEHFMKTFTQANEHFSRIFTTLFKKGKAHLELDNPKSPFEDGLSIKVKIAGNRFMDLKSLSGGEKTLTALSFIFAIQEYQPASFYVLDEIDAALDKHNAEKLAKLIRQYSDRAQYVVISHNDSLISEADTLFGVSMTHGISKVTSLKI
ncbi:chromosome segregation protein SMC [archaeon]|nr:chromosome segregation protein SMC [archaeon]